MIIINKIFNLNIRCMFCRNICMPKTRISILLLLIVFFSCNKAEIDHSLDKKNTYRDYYPMKTGREMIYKLDSIVPAAFGVRLDTNSYFIKDIVNNRQIENKDTVFTINRFISNDISVNNWIFQYTYMVRFKENTLELTEKENVYEDSPVPINGLVDLKFIKLANPINDNIIWNGNRYFTQGNAGTASYLYKYNNWEYRYSNIDAATQILQTNYPETITIVSSNQLSGDTNIEKPQNYQLRIFSKEIYAKNAGLIYKEFIYTDYQPANSTSPGYQGKSFGIVLRLINQLIY